MKKRVIIIYITFFCAPIICANKALHKLSLDDALQKAYRNRTSLQSQVYRIKQQMNLEWVELSQYFPQLSIRTEINKVSRNLLPKHQTFISLRQLVFATGGPILQYKAAKENTEVAKYNREREQDAVQFETETSYLDLWNTAQQNNVIKALEFSAQKQFANAQTRNDEGLLNKAEWKDQIAQFEENIATVRSYEDALSSAYYALERSIENHITAPLNDRNTYQFIEQSILAAHNAEDVEYYIKKAFLHRKELAVVEHEIQREEYNKQFNERSYIPTLSFFADFSNGTFFSLLSSTSSQTYWELGISFDWKFDGLGSAHRANAAHDSKLERTMEKYNLTAQIKLEVQTAYYDLQQLLKQLDAAYARYNQAQEEYAQRKIQFDIGEISCNDFAQAEYNWQQAQFTLLDTKVQNAQKYRELLFRCGYPSEPRKHFLEKYDKS